MATDEKHLGKLEGKIALITGGNSGIGLATAKRFVNEGAFFITGRRQSQLDAAVKEIGKNVTAIQGNVAKLEDLGRLFTQIKKEKGKIDVLFANAGVAKCAPFGAITEELYDSIFDIRNKWSRRRRSVASGSRATSHRWLRFSLPQKPNGSPAKLSASQAASANRAIKAAISEVTVPAS